MLTLTIFSGLPGTGKTTLSLLAARHLGVPLIQLDAILDIIPAHMLDHAEPFWDDMMQIVLGVAEMHLTHGLSVIIDAVFMGRDRILAHRLARRRGAHFCPIYTYVSDTQLWRERVEQRLVAMPAAQPATWAGIQQQQSAFQPWDPGSAVFVDGVASVEDNLARVLTAITAGALTSAR